MTSPTRTSSTSPQFEYVELHASSAFSFLEAASQPEALIARAAELQIPTVALLDRNGLYGAPRFHTHAKEKGTDRPHRRRDLRLGLRLQPTPATRVAPSTSIALSRRASPFSAPARPAIRTSRSSSPASKCASPPRQKAPPLSLDHGRILPRAHRSHRRLQKAHSRRPSHTVVSPAPAPRLNA